MKKFISVFLSLAMAVSVFTACGGTQSDAGTEVEFTGITLSDDGVMVGGEAASTDTSSAVYVSNDIIFYLEGQGAEYGEGDASEGHSQAEADRHTVINITQPGNYVVSGSISNGQIAVNLGKDSKKDPDAVVNITLNNADITCTVAPAIVCYKAYECGTDDLEKATKDVDTSTAGFNITIADGSVNNINGSHVAKIYEPGTTDKLHKYDAAIQSMVTCNINGSDGVLNLTSDNEGIETKMHLTINGGEININSADDSLNASEDGVSVITINDGKVVANSNGGSEGDGIDSNGWLVINGGYVSAFGNSGSMDSGLDSDNGIYINNGTVFATGNMYDEIAQGSAQTYAVFNFGTRMEKGKVLVLKSSQGVATVALESVAGGTNWIYSSPMLVEDDYTAYKADGVDGEGVNGIYANIKSVTGEVQLAHLGAGMTMGRPFMGGGNMPQGGMDFEMPKGERPQQDTLPNGVQNMNMPQGNRPQGGFGNMTPPQGFDGKMPEGFNGQFPQGGQMPEGFDFSFIGHDQSLGQAQPVFTIVKGGNTFSGITEYTAE